MTTNTTTIWSKSFFFACLANVLTGISFYQISVTLPFYIIEHFKVSESKMTYILSSYVLSALIIRLFSGYLVDTFPRKKVYLLAFSIFVSLFLGYTIASSILFLFILRIFHGLAWGVLTTSSNTLAIDLLPQKKRGQGIGYYGLMSTLAMSLGPIFGMYIYENFEYNAIFYTAFLIGLIGVVFAYYIESPINQKVKSKVTSLKIDQFILTKALPIAFNILLIEITYGALYTFGVMYGKYLKIENSSLIFLSIAIGIASSRIFSGKLIDRGWINQINIAGIFSICLGYFLLTIPHYSWFFFLGAYLIGIGFGVSIPAFQTQFMNMTSPEKRGTANSTFFIAIDIGIGFGMITSGYIVTHYGFKNLFIIITCLSLISLIYYVLISRNTYNSSINS